MRVIYSKQLYQCRGVDVQGFMEQIFNFNLADYTPLNTQQAGYSAAFIAAYTIHKVNLVKCFETSWLILVKIT